jgi:hypothetical protein
MAIHVLNFLVVIWHKEVTIPDTFLYMPCFEIVFLKLYFVFIFMVLKGLSKTYF